MVQKVPKKPHERGPEYVRNGKGYIWFEMTFFTRWEYPNKCQVLCIDAPFDFPDELEKRLRNHIEPLNYGDPFSLHADLIDLMIVYSDISVWRVRDPIRELEKVSTLEVSIPGTVLATYMYSVTTGTLGAKRISTNPRDLTACHPHV